MFEIKTNPVRKLVVIKLRGMLTKADVAELYRQERDAIAAMSCALGEHLALVDLTDCPLQLQEVVNAFEREIGSSAKARRLAMVTGKALAKMQARRIMKRDGAAIFETIEQAEAWLFSPLEKAA